MQSIIKKLPNNLLEITIKETGKTFEKYYTKTIEELKNRISLKWFRKGNVPNEAIIKEYGEKNIEAEALQSFMDDYYQKVLKKENIIPTGSASIKEIRSTNPIELVLEVEVLPEITINEQKLTKIKLKKTVVTVTKDEIDTEIKQIENKFTKYEVTNKDAIIENGDWYQRSR